MKPSETRDFYERLGVPKTASEDELKKAYRSLAQQWHPDHNPSERKHECELEFIAISEAFKTLSDNVKPILEGVLSQGKDYNFYNNFYQDFLKSIAEVSPELAAATRLFCGNSMPLGLEALFRDFYGK